MPITLIAALVIVFLVVAFSLQNAKDITIDFFQWSFQGNLVIVLLGTLCLGMIIYLLASMPSRLKKARQITKLQKRIAELEHSLSEKVQPPK